MGSSKALDGFPPLAELLLEKVDGERPRRPLFAITAGPAKPASVLFIENPSAFASQLRAGFPAGHLAVCAFGYGLTIENIGRRLEDGSVIAWPAAGERPDLSALVKPTPCFFWGDLDLEGLRIYEALGSAILHLKLSSIYQRMASMLSVRRTSHPYGALFGSGKAGQRPPRGDTPEVRTLARLCALERLIRKRFAPSVTPKFSSSRSLSETHAARAVPVPIEAVSWRRPGLYELSQGRSADIGGQPRGASDAVIVRSCWRIRT
jgi:hypothetical protein